MYSKSHLFGATTSWTASASKNEKIQRITAEEEGDGVLDRKGSVKYHFAV